MWWSWRAKEEPTYDPDRKVTLAIGKLTEALTEALKVVEYAPAEQPSEPVEEPLWKRGDRAYVEVEVTGEQGGYTNFVLADAKHISLALPASRLLEDRV